MERPSATSARRRTRRTSPSRCSPSSTTSARRKGKGGNEFIDVDEALGYELPPVRGEFDERDLALYALGVGAAKDPLDAKELSYVYEMSGDGLPDGAHLPRGPRHARRCSTWRRRASKRRAFTTGSTASFTASSTPRSAPPGRSSGKLDAQDEDQGHLRQGQGRARHHARSTTTDESGQELAYNEMHDLRARRRRLGRRAGAERGRERRRRAARPTRWSRRRPTRTRRSSTASRATGTRCTRTRRSRRTSASSGPSSTASARSASQRATSCPSSRREATRASSRASRCASPTSVFPGETLVTEMWKESDTQDRLPTKVKERDKVVISNAAVELFKELPKKPPRSLRPSPPPRQAPRRRPATSSRAPTSSRASRTTSRDTPELVSKIGKVFVFKLTSPDSAWTIDVKNGAGQREGRRGRGRLHARAHGRRLHGDDERQGRRDEALHGRQAQDQRRRDGVAEAVVPAEDRPGAGARGHPEEARRGRRSGGCRSSPREGVRQPRSPR